MKTTQLILDEIILVVLNINLWGGRKALKSKDLAMNGIDIGKLPPGTLATLGSKRIISPKAVRIFSTLRTAAKKLCLQNGVRFGGYGYAVPRERIETISLELKRIKDEFETAKENFLAVYQQEVEQWIASNPPEWTQIIRGAVDTPCHVNKAISFNYAAIDIRTPADIAENGLDAEVDSLYGQLCHEVRLTARRAYENKFVGRQEVSQKALRPIKTIRAKLAGMVFLDPSIADILQVIDDTLGKLPVEGHIKGTDLNMVAGLLGRQLANMGRVMPEEPESEDEPQGEHDEDDEHKSASSNTGAVTPVPYDF